MKTAFLMILVIQIFSQSDLFAHPNYLCPSDNQILVLQN